MAPSKQCQTWDLLLEIIIRSGFGEIALIVVKAAIGSTPMRKGTPESQLAPWPQDLSLSLLTPYAETRVSLDSMNIANA